MGIHSSCTTTATHFGFFTKFFWMEYELHNLIFTHLLINYFGLFLIQSHLLFSYDVQAIQLHFICFTDLSSLCVISQSISHTLRHRETDLEEASMECYSYRRRRSSSSSRGYPYSRIDNFVTDDDEEEENEKIAVVLGQRQSSDLNFKNTKRRGIPLPKLQRAIMSSIVLLKRYRDSYVGVMHSLAEHVVQLNNGNSYFFKKLPNAP